jgi:hypothetical protein
MTVTPFPRTQLHPLAADPEPKPSFGRRLLNGLSYTAAVTLGLTVAPALVILSDRGTFLHWANYILDVVGSH